MNALLDRLVSRFPQNQRGAFRCSPLVEPPAIAPDPLVRRFFALFPDNQRGAFRCFPFFDGLPNEVFVHILRFLDLESKATCRLVCGEWNQAILELSLLRFAKLKLKMTYSVFNDKMVVGSARHDHEERIAAYGCDGNFKFPSNYRFETLVLEKTIRGALPIYVLQLPQLQNITKCSIVFWESFAGPLQPVDLWAQCMKMPTLEQMECVSRFGYPLKFMTAHGRSALPRLELLFLKDFETTVAELLFLLANVAEGVITRIECSLDEFLRFLEGLIENPRAIALRVIHVEDIALLGQRFPATHDVTIKLVPSKRLTRADEVPVDLIYPQYRISIRSEWEVDVYGNYSSVFCHAVGAPCNDESTPIPTFNDCEWI